KRYTKTGSLETSQPFPFATVYLPSSTWLHVDSCGEHTRTPHGITRVWPQPGKEPLADVDRAVLIAVHLEPTGPTAIRALVERHGLDVPTPATGLARLAFI